MRRRPTTAGPPNSPRREFIKERLEAAGSAASAMGYLRQAVLCEDVELQEACTRLAAQGEGGVGRTVAGRLRAGQGLGGARQQGSRSAAGRTATRLSHCTGSLHRVPTSAASHSLPAGFHAAYRSDTSGFPPHVLLGILAHLELEVQCEEQVPHFL